MSGDTISRVPRPRTGETPQHNVRVPADLWSAAVAKARAEGTTLSKVIVKFLREYVGGSAARRDEG
jgi:predicted HicB family RNase H-like nuclease